MKLPKEFCHMPTIPSRDNAGVIAPAPILYGIAFAVGFAAEQIVPTQLLPFPASAWLGLTLIAVAIAIVVSAFKALSQAHTAFDARKSTTKIVTTGAFRFSRNPTYLSLTLLLIGIAFAISSLWVLVSVIPAVMATQWGVILREERYLKEKFGEGYSSYASKVRRWL
jgi:protein-S-isoprenylcysteine O-methyltransferase Ste14